MRPLLAATAVLILASLASAQAPLPTTSEQDRRVAERFRHADTNGDGFITSDEARAAHLWFEGDFSSVDADHSGTVTLFELGQALQRRLSQSMQEFDAADTNHDGRLSAEEAKKAPRVVEVFSAAKRAKPPTMDRAEFQSHALERLYRDSELPSVAPNIIEKRF